MEDEVDSQNNFSESTQMFHNYSSLYLQDVSFEKDQWDHLAEFENLEAGNPWGNLLWPSMVGLVVIKNNS